MPGLIAREGPEDAPATVIVVEPVDDAPPLVLRDPPGPLERSAWIERPWTVAPTGTVPFFERRVKLIIDHQFHPPRVNQVALHEEPELPHDHPGALEGFVESVYLLHGWETVRLHAADLDRMVRLVTQRAPRSPFDDPGAIERWHEESARQRMGDASAYQVRRWRAAHAGACAELRTRVLGVMRKLEEHALQVARERLFLSVATVDDEALRYFAFRDVEAAEAALGTQGAPRFDESKDGVGELRDHLAALKEAAKRVVETQDEIERQTKIIEGTSAREHWDVEAPITAALAALQRAQAALPGLQAELAVAVAPRATDHPVLYRFNAKELVAAAEASTKYLGELVFDRLQGTFEAARTLWETLIDHTPAKDAADTDIAAGTLPEQAVGDKAAHSVWLYPRIVEAAIARLADDAEAEIAVVAADNVRPFHEREERIEAVLEVAATVTLTGLAIALHAVCPPAGLALDVGLSAADIYRSDKAYTDQKADALCDLDPRNCFAEPPSVLPLVFSVAAAAMVVH